MGYKSFRLVATVAIGLFIAAIFLWPAIATSAVGSSGCRGAGGGACGAFLVNFGIFGRQALTSVIALVLLVIVVLRSRTLGLPLLVTLPILAALPHLNSATTALNNFWGVGFATGLGSSIFGYLSLIMAIGPTIVAGFIIWNLASRRREAALLGRDPDSFEARALKIFSALYLAGNLIALLSLLSPLIGILAIRTVTRTIAPLVVPLTAVNSLIGIGLICFLWYAIGRNQGAAEDEWDVSESDFADEEYERG
jgi:hypothetical protein